MALHGADVWQDGKPMPVLDFSSNVNPLAPPKGLMEDLRKYVSLSKYYPEPDARSARTALAEFHGLRPENIVIGNGANELIHLFFEAVPKGRTLIIAPTYSEYEQASIGHGHQPYFHVVRYPFTTNLNEVIIKKNTSLVFLCNPNNPTGEVLSKHEILSFYEEVVRAGAALVLDEVHMDLSDKETETLMTEAGDGLIVLRSLTKLLGVPGLRLGYSISSQEVSKKIDSVRPAWNVNVLAIETINHWLNKEFFDKSREYAKKERKFLGDALSDLGLEVLPSHANYFLIKLKRKVAHEIKISLLKKGILIRDASSIRGLDEHYIRIGVLNHSKNLILIKSLKEIIDQLGGL